MYVDGIFNPNFLTDESIFLREGWHLENAEDGKVDVSGVVFNEMKAHMLNKLGIEFGGVMQSVFPGTCFAFEAGGDICAIPALTYERYCSYYKHYYHPSNSILVMSGKLDILSYLAKLDAEYSKYNRRRIQFNSVKTSHRGGTFTEGNKPITKSESLGEELNDVWITFVNYDGLTNLEKIVLHAMFMYFNSYNEHKIRYKLLKDEWCEETSYFIDEVTAGCMYGMIFEDVTDADAKDLSTEFMNHLTRVRDEGIDYRNMKILLRVLENYYTEEIVDEDYAATVAENLFLGKDIFGDMSYKECFAFLRDKLENDIGYFQDVVNKYFLSCTDFNVATFKPIKNYKKKLEKEFQKIVNPWYSKWTKEEKAYITSVEENLADKIYAESEVVDVPRLEVSDIVTDVKWNESKTVNVLGKKVNAYIIPDSDSVYLNMDFDISNLSVKETAVFTAISQTLFYNFTKKRTNVETSFDSAYLFDDYDTEIKFNNLKDSEKVERFFKIKLRIKKENIKEAMELFGDILINSSYGHVINTYSCIYWSMIETFGMTCEKPDVVAPMIAKSAFSNADNIKNMTMGPEATKYLYNLLIESNSKKDMKKLAIMCQKIFKRVFNLSRMSLFISGEEQALDELAKALRVNLKDMPKTLSEMDSVYVPVTKGFRRRYEAAGINSLVQYNAMCIDVRDKMKDFEGDTDVICSYLKEWIVHKLIRENGNAYGSNVKYSDGIFTFTSYRDPNVEASFDVFANAGIILKQMKIKDFDKHKIAAAGKKNMFSTEIEKIEEIERYKRKGKTESDMKKDAEAILNTTEEDLLRVCEYLSEAAKNQQFDYYCIGNPDIITKSREGLLTKVVLY
ncbi:MAG: insulinase family protein [Clostridia bacterium]|nr:insulinase family protein [Clostridia bacterium]